MGSHGDASGPMGTPWGHHGDPMGFAWGSHGVRMGTPWGPHGVGPHGSPWCAHGSPWEPHGIPWGPMETPWDPMETPWASRGDPMGCRMWSYMKQRGSGGAQPSQKSQGVRGAQPRWMRGSVGGRIREFGCGPWAHRGKGVGGDQFFFLGGFGFSFTGHLFFKTQEAKMPAMGQGSCMGPGLTWRACLASKFLFQPENMGHGILGHAQSCRFRAHLGLMFVVSSESPWTSSRRRHLINTWSAF